MLSMAYVRRIQFEGTLLLSAVGKVSSGATGPSKIPAYAMMAMMEGRF